jgi:hypothetical protein
MSPIRRTLTLILALTLLGPAVPAAHAAQTVSLTPLVEGGTDFGAPRIGETAAREFILENTTNSPLWLRDVTGDHDPASGAIQYDHDCPVSGQTSTTLNPGQTCRITFYWTPARAGKRTVPVWVITDLAIGGQAESNKLPLTVGATAVELSSSTFIFQPRALGSISGTGSVLVTALAPDRKLAVRVEGAGRSQFFVHSDACTTEAVTGECEILIRFAPDTLGPVAATVVVTDTETGERQAIALNGTGVEAPTAPKGDTGAPGTDGTNGAQGAAGPQGERGAVGMTGAIGTTGPSGANGAQGAQGAAGPRGPAGASPCRATSARRIATRRSSRRCCGSRRTILARRCPSRSASRRSRLTPGSPATR